MDKNKTFWGMLLISAIYGLIFSLIINSVFDKVIEAIWTPLAIALIFLLFSIPLIIIITGVSKKKKTHCDVPGFFRHMIIVVIALGILSGLFEVLYEIDANISCGEANSYIFLIDDSGSMSSSDPQNIRLSSIEKILSDKGNTFPYAVYTFSDQVELAKPMDVSHNGLGDISLHSAGGTAIYGVLNQVIVDIEAHSLNIYDSTRVILISDGEASDIGRFGLNLEQLLREYGNKELIISTIGLGDGVNTSLMKIIANYTGGGYIHISDVNELTDAMIEASVNLSNRNLLGFRGYCKTNTLHAAMRIVFLLIISIIIGIMKLYAYGKYYKKQIILECFTSVGAAVLLEVLLEKMVISESVARMLFFILIALTIIETLATSQPGNTDESPICNENGQKKRDLEDGSYIDGEHKESNIIETKHVN